MNVLLKMFKVVSAVTILLSTGVARVWVDDIPEFSKWNFKTSGEERFRYEYRHDFDLNESRKDNGSQFYNRLRLSESASLTDEYLKPKLDLFVEGLDAQTGGYQ